MNLVASLSFAFLFLVKGLIPGMDFCCEIEKLPNLLEHYEEHKSCNEDSFLTFLVDDYLNYGADSKDHHDTTDHEDLPFHGNHKCCCTSAFYASYQSFSLAIFEFPAENRFGRYLSFNPSGFPNTRFQPPKV